MPSSTPKQARFMAAVANNPQFAVKVGIPQKVGQEFNQADTALSPKAKIVRAIMYRKMHPNAVPKAPSL